MLCRIFLLILLAFLLCYCSAPSLDSREIEKSSDLRSASLTAFDEHVRPALDMCAGCHGKARAPLFMVEDTPTAHDAALSNVNFDNIDKSNFLKRIIKDKHNCGDCEGETVRSALTKWQEARAAAGNKDMLGVSTQQLSLPSHPQEKQWDIGKFISDDYSGGSIMLSVRIEPDSANKRYSLINLSITTDKIDVYIKSIKPLINGKWNSKNTAYKDIACAVKSTEQRPNGHIIQATGTSIVPDDFTADNKLSFAIAEVRLAQEDDPSCWSDDIHKDMFTNSMRPIIADNCEKSGCHGSESRGVDGDILSSYSNVMEKTNTIKAVLTGENTNHIDRITALDDDSKQQLLDWLNK